MPVLDELDQRLARAAGTAPDPGPALADVLRRADRPSHRSRRLLVAAIMAVVLAGSGLAIRLGSGDDPTVRTGSSTTVPSPTTSTSVPTPTTEPIEYVARPGYVPVADHEGNLAGYVPDNPNLDPLPTFALGTGAPLSGQVVVDQDDVPTGYEIVGLGFVSNAQAADPAEVDRLVAEHEADEREAREYLRQHPDATAPARGPGG